MDEPPVSSENTGLATRASAERAGEGRGLRTFFVIWAGQLLSLVGSGLTGFALGVWVFQKTGSATLFAMIALAATLPAILISPLAGALVDRWDRRRVMIASDAGAAAATLVIALLYISGRLEIWHIALVSALGSAAGAFQGPAWTASVSLLVPKAHYGRAGGMAQLSRGLSGVISPVLAGVLMVSIGLGGVMLIDFATFLIAVGTLLAVRIPRPAAAPVKPGERKSLLREAGQGWTFIRERPGLRGMMVLFALLNFLLGMVSVLVTPMVLSFTTPQRLGALLSVSSVGMLGGSIAMSLWGGPRRRIHGVLGFLVLVGLGVMLVGLRPAAVVVSAGLFVAMLAVPVVNGSTLAIWQSKVPAALQGRVFATLGMVAMAAMPLAYLISGPLADRVFNPLVVEGGPLADSLGGLVGVGPGRGVGLLFLLAGALVILSSLAAYLDPHLRRVEDELPDATSDAPAPAAEVSA